MKRKGFTLIEILAVIVILAVIALISTPIIIGIIEKTKEGAALDSIHGIINAAKIYKAEQSLDTNEDEITIDLAEDELSYNGTKPDGGILQIDEEGNIYVIAKYGKYCIKKEYTEERPKKVGESNCENIKVPTFIYGIKRSLNTSSSAWERIESSVGLEANAQVGTTPVKNDFDSIYPWSDIISYNYSVDTKKITAYYGDENFKFDGSNGEVLTKIPAFYYKRYQDEENEYIYISKKAREGYIKSEEFSVGRYTMSLDSTKVHSKSGQKPLVNTSITDFRTYARKLGEEFGILDYHYFLLQMLYLVEYADYNSQTKLGYGYTNSSHTGSTKSGGCNALGMKSGSVDGTDNTSMIYRGIEDIYGNIWQFVDGINIRNNQTYICYDKSKYAIDTFDGCYKPIGYLNASTVGFASKLGYDAENPIVNTPIEALGSESTNMGDYFDRTENKDRLAILGGRWNDSSKSGMWYWSFMEPFTLAAYDDTGTRLIKS